MKEDNEKQDDKSMDTANIRQTNAQQSEQGEINMGGSEFTGDGTDIQTSSSGLPTMNPDLTGDDNPKAASNRARKS